MTPYVVSILLTFIRYLTHCGLCDFNEILDENFSSQLQWLMAEILEEGTSPNAIWIKIQTFQEYVACKISAILFKFNKTNSQILECTCLISHNASSRTEMCVFSVLNGALWDTGQVRCGICETGLLCGHSPCTQWGLVALLVCCWWQFPVWKQLVMKHATSASIRMVSKSHLGQHRKQNDSDSNKTTNSRYSRVTTVKELFV